MSVIKDMMKIDPSAPLVSVRTWLLSTCVLAFFSVAAQDENVLKSWSLSDADHAGWEVISPLKVSDAFGSGPNSRWIFDGEGARVGWGIGSEPTDHAFVTDKESWLISPELDLTSLGAYEALGLSFESATRYAGTDIDIYFKAGERVEVNTEGWQPISGKPCLPYNTATFYLADKSGEPVLSPSALTQIASATELSGSTKLRLAIRYRGGAYSSALFGLPGETPSVKEWLVRDISILKSTASVEVANPTGIEWRYGENGMEGDEIWIRWDHKQQTGSKKDYEYLIYFEYMLGNDTWNGRFQIAQGKLEGSWESVGAQMHRIEYETIDGRDMPEAGQYVKLRGRLLPSTRYHRMAVQARYKKPAPYGVVSEKVYRAMNFNTIAQTLRIERDTEYDEGSHGMYDIVIAPGAALSVPHGEIAVFNTLTIESDGKEWGGLASRTYYDTGNDGTGKLLLYRPGLRVLNGIRATAYMKYDIWSYIGLPFAPVWTSVKGNDFIPDGNMRVLWYDEALRATGASGFVNITARPDKRLRAFEGYTMKVGRGQFGENTATPVPVTFMAPANSEEVFNYSPYAWLDGERILYEELARELKVTSTDCPDADYTGYPGMKDYDRGWNLIGSTFGCATRFTTEEGILGAAGDLPRYAYVDDSERDGYRYVRRGEALIGSFQSLFVQLPDDRSLFFNGADRVSHPMEGIFAPASGSAGGSLTLRAEGSGGDDRVTLLSETGAGSRFEPGYDLGKMMNGNGYNLYLIKGEVPCAVRYADIPAEGASFALRFTASAAGRHTLTAEENTFGDAYEAVLTDPVAGKTHPLAEGPYGFDLTAAATRDFTLTLRARNGNALENATLPRVTVFREGTALRILNGDEAAEVRLYGVGGALLGHRVLAAGESTVIQGAGTGIVLLNVTTASGCETYKLNP